MTTEELIAAVRIRLDDIVTPTLVSTATILEQASLTQTEFARSTLVLYNVVAGAIVAGNPWVVVPNDFCVLKTVVLNGTQLRPITLSELDFGYCTLGGSENVGRFSNWRTYAGTPKFVVVDTYLDRVRLVPYSITDEVVSLEGYVIPPNLFFDGDGILPAVNPQIPAYYHEVLLAGILLRLFSLFDVDIFNSSKAQIYGMQWTQGLVEAQNNLRTSLRRQVRIMDLPRGFAFDTSRTPQIANNAIQ